MERTAAYPQLPVRQCRLELHARVASCDAPSSFSRSCDGACSVRKCRRRRRRRRRRAAGAAAAATASPCSESIKHAGNKEVPLIVARRARARVPGLLGLKALRQTLLRRAQPRSGGDSDPSVARRRRSQRAGQRRVRVRRRGRVCRAHARRLRGDRRLRGRAAAVVRRLRVRVRGSEGARRRDQCCCTSRAAHKLARVRQRMRMRFAVGGL